MEKLTSPLILKWVYEKKDIQGLVDEVAAGGHQAICGHFPVYRYRDVFPDAKYFTLMREPSARVWSAYRHYCRNGGYAGTLEDFFMSSQHQNVQSRFMGDDTSNFDFVGLTEQYTESIRRLSSQLDLVLPERLTNEAPSDDGLAEPTKEEWERIASLNSKDWALYESVVSRFAAE